MSDLESKWREEFRATLSNNYNGTSFSDGEIDGHWFSEWQYFKAAKTSSYEREQKIITALKCCENDYWFMTNLLEKYSTNRDEAIKSCIERMKFRKPIFEVIK